MKARTQRLILGVGVNDAGHRVGYRDEAGKRRICPYYLTWRDMLARCYGEVLG